MIGLTSMEARTLLRDRDSTHLLPDDCWVRITNALPWSGESLYLQVGYVADKRPAKCQCRGRPSPRGRHPASSRAVRQRLLSAAVFSSRHHRPRARSLPHASLLVPPTTPFSLAQKLTVSLRMY